MKFYVSKSNISGTVDIPSSKSHTIRALFFAMLAKGQSKIIRPLLSQDGISAYNVAKLFGADISQQGDSYIVNGTGGNIATPQDVINTGNSGTTMNLALSIATLAPGITVLTGDEQVRSRSIAPLVEALNNLGARAETTLANGKPPVIIRGQATGGHTSLSATSSQYLTSLMISAPLWQNDTTIHITTLSERPYVELTMWWLDKLNIHYKNDNFKTIHIKGRQHYQAFTEAIPADFSSATFFMALAAISGATLRLRNLDMSDKQGDKDVLYILEKMGAKIKFEDSDIIISGGTLNGIDIDLNATPDALPALSVVACFAKGTTRIYNVSEARNKETDRISAMYTELSKLGARVQETTDGLIISQSQLRGTTVDGRKDHRIIMSLAILGLCLDDGLVIENAEAVSVTFPNFVELIRNIGGNIKDDNY